MKMTDKNYSELYRAQREVCINAIVAWVKGEAKEEDVVVMVKAFFFLQEADSFDRRSVAIWDLLLGCVPFCSREQQKSIKSFLDVKNKNGEL